MIKTLLQRQKYCYMANENKLKINPKIPYAERQ